MESAEKPSKLHQPLPSKIEEIGKKTMDAA